MLGCPERNFLAMRRPSPRLQMTVGYWYILVCSMLWPISGNFSYYYAGIMLDADSSLLCSKLCGHNVDNPIIERGVNFINASIIDKGNFHITKFLGAPSSRLTRTITLALFQDNTAFFLTKIINHLFTPNFTLFNVNHALSSKKGGFHVVIFKPVHRSY